MPRSRRVAVPLVGAVVLFLLVLSVALPSRAGAAAEPGAPESGTTPDDVTAPVEEETEALPGPPASAERTEEVEPETSPGGRTEGAEVETDPARDAAVRNGWWRVDPATVDDHDDGPVPYASRYAPPAAEPLLIRGAVVLTGTGERLEGAQVLVEDGRIAAVGPELDAPADATVVDAAGRWLTPGLIDAHSHLGDYPAPSVSAHADGNERTSPVTGQVWAEHSVWPQDPQFPLALMGGVTTLHVLPGSANLFGGRGVTLKNVPARSVMDMKFPDAPHSLKIACGENPKRVYGGKGRFPATRMGNVAGYRNAWLQAREYLDEVEAWERGDEGAKRPDRNLELETLAGVLRGEILVQNHCYRADEMLLMLEVAREFGFEITAFHHATEAYKIADVLADEGVCAAMWADWWGFKLEAFDAVQENVALVDAAGACAIVHSDSARDIQRLNQEAAKAMAAGRRAGMEIEPAEAIRWITSEPARALGIDDRVGRIAPGYTADLVLWSGDPFSVYSRPQRVWIDGVTRFEAGADGLRPVTDFDLGQTPAGRRAGPAAGEE